MSPTRQLRPSFQLGILLLASLPSVAPFSFSYSAPTQCGQLSVAWTGGTAPYYLLITPTFAAPANITIPASSYANGKGNFSTTLDVASQKQFLLTMSDSTGFGSGGTSGLLTVGDPLSGAPSCNTTVPTVPFDFQLNTALQQCRQFTFSDYTAAIQPVTIYGLIPLGTTFIISPPAGPSNYTWIADLKANTQVVFTMVDSQGRNGGSSDLLYTTTSDDTSCINANSPASTVTGAPTQTSAGGGSTGTSAPSSGGSGNGGVIGGAVAGGIVLILVLASLIWFFCIRKRQGGKDTPHISTRFNQRKGQHEPIDLDPHEPHSAIEGPGNNYEPEPYVLPASVPRTASSQAPSEGGVYPPGHPGSAWFSNEDSSTTGDRTAPLPGSSRTSKYSEAFRNAPPNTPARFVLHTDAGELPEATEEPEVVELPPQYNSLGGMLPARAPTYRERGGRAALSGNTASGSSSVPSGGEGQPAGPSS